MTPFESLSNTIAPILEEQLSTPVFEAEYAQHTSEPQSLSSLLLSLGESPIQNLAALLKFGPSYLQCERLFYGKEEEEAPIVSGHHQSVKIPVENNSKTLSLYGLRKSPNPEHLSIFVSLLAQQEIRLRDIERVGDLESYTKTLFEACPDGVVVTDDYGVIINANRAMVAITRKPKESLVGSRVNQLADGKGRAEAFKALRRLREHHRARFDCRIRVGAGRTIPVSISFRDFEFQGRPLILATARDLSDLEDEVTLCTSYEKSLARTIDNASDGFVRYDQFGRIVQANPQIEKLTGHDANRLVNRPIDDLLSISCLRNFRRAVAKLNENGYASFHCAINHVDGTEIPTYGTLMQFELEGERFCRLMLQDKRKLAE